jgi:hypothetical protein
VESQCLEISAASGAHGLGGRCLGPRAWRTRLTAGPAQSLRFETWLTWCRDHRLVKTGRRREGPAGASLRRVWRPTSRWAGTQQPADPEAPDARQPTTQGVGPHSRLRRLAQRWRSRRPTAHPCHVNLSGTAPDCSDPAAAGDRAAAAVSFAIVCPTAKRSADARMYLDQPCQQDASIARAHALIQAFLTIVRERRGGDLET